MLPRIGSRGLAAAEFALMAPALLLLLLGGYDVANLVQTSIRLERAARAGAQYAAADPSNMAAVQSQVIAAWPDLTTANVPLPSHACQCGTTAVACTQTCADGLVETVTVTAQRTLTPFLLHGVTTGHGSAVVRIR